MNAVSIWYQELARPGWAPPGWLFEPVWTVLYFLIAVSFVTVFQKVCKRELPRKIALPFALNLFFNFAFIPIQFYLQNNYVALADVLLVFFTLLWAMVLIYRKIRWVAFLNIPYLLWSAYALALQIAITMLNR